MPHRAAPAGVARPDGPNSALARKLVKDAIGDEPEAVTRFGTGSRHYVYDVRFAKRWPIVIRIGDRCAHAEMAGAVTLSQRLRPLGVPLPALLAKDTESEFPWLVLERLPGRDLGDVIASLSKQQRDSIAAGVVAAQAIVADTGSSTRYGYAVGPEAARFSTWSQFLIASLGRSRRRMAVAKLFDTSLVDRLEDLVTAHLDQLDAIQATPFLHDTTTKNVIISADGRLSGIVDVDDLCFGDPRYPAALTFAVLIGYGGPVEYVWSWLRHARLKDDFVFRLYVTVFLIDLMAEHGQRFNGNERRSCSGERTKLLRAFQSNFALTTDLRTSHAKI